MSSQRYDVTVDGQALATDYPFRTSETAIGQLTAWHLEGLSGLTVQEIALDGEQARPGPCVP